MRPACILSLALLSFSTYSNASPATFKHKETIHEAEAAHVKHLVRTVTTGTMASVFPEGLHEGRPFALMEYHAPCHPTPSLTFLLLPISMSVKNILSNEKHQATYTLQDHISSKSAMSRGRVAFIGNMTLLPDLMYEERKQLTKCYLSYHPDAKRWLPDAKDPPHLAMWARLDVEDIYYVGGFGDSHYIGFIPVDLYSETGFGWGLDLQ